MLDRYRALSALWLALSVIPAADLVAQSASSRREGDPQVEIEERVVVSASRTEQLLTDVGSAVSLITRAEIETSGAAWLRDVLDPVPGISVVSSGGPGRVTSVFTRGANNSNHTLVLIDGRKVNTPTTGAFDLGSIPSSLVERVEVLRGPQSVLYGSEAVGGVVHVITRRPGPGLSAEMGLSRGAWATNRGTLGVSGRSGEWSGTVHGEWFDSAGFSAADGEGELEPDGFDNRAATGRLAWANGRESALVLLAVVHGDSDIDGFAFGVGPVDDPEQTQSSRILDAAARLALARDTWSTELTVSLSDQRLEVVDPHGFTPFFGLEADLVEVDLQSSVRLADATLVGGVEHRRESAVTISRSAFGDSGYIADTRTTGVWTDLTLVFGKGWQLGSGARLESHSRFGQEATWRTTAAKRIADGLWLHGSAGSGFRAPSLNELYFPFFGNPELAPESNRGWDAGLRMESGDRRIVIDVTYWRSSLRDLVEFGATGFVNVGRATTRGLEVESTWAPNRRWSVRAGYTLTDAETADDELPLLRRPRQQGSLQVAWSTAARVSLSTTLRVVGERPDFGPSGRLELAPYGRLDLNGRFPLGEGFEASLRIDNALDARYQEVFGYRTASRSATLGAAYRWGR